MQYYVVTPDGQQYGPATVDVLKQWVSENRLNAQSLLKDATTGQTLAAGQVPDLFPPVATPPPAQDPMLAPVYQQPPQQQHPYPQVPQMPQANYTQGPSYYRNPMSSDAQADKADLMSVVVRAAIALVFVAIFRYAGLILSIFACVHAFTKFQGNRYGVWMILIALGTLAIVGSTWLLRFNGMISF